MFLTLYFWAAVLMRTTVCASCPGDLSHSTHMNSPSSSQNRLSFPLCLSHRFSFSSFPVFSRDCLTCSTRLARCQFGLKFFFSIFFLQRGQHKGPWFPSSHLSQYVVMQILQLLCPQSIATGSLKESRQIGHVASSSTSHSGVSEAVAVALSGFSLSLPVKSGKQETFTV